MENVMVQFDIPGMTSQVYDQVWQDLRKAGHENPKGLIHHAAAPIENGLKIVDVWESADHFKKFGETLMPILAKNGIQQAQPAILPLYNVYDVNKNMQAH